MDRTAMKRSRSIRLVLLGSVGLVGLVGCDDKPEVAEGQFFRDPAECRRVLGSESCEASFAEAQKKHVETAPRFASRESCEAQFGAGNCGPAPGAAGQQAAAGQSTPGQATPGQSTPGQPGQQAQSGGGFFMPLMFGYMLGNMMNRGATAQPLYRDSRNTVYSGGRSLGTVRAGAGARSGTIASPTTQRGGFGASGRSFSAGS